MRLTLRSLVGILSVSVAMDNWKNHSPPQGRPRKTLPVTFEKASDAAMTWLLLKTSFATVNDGRMNNILSN